MTVQLSAGQASRRQISACDYERRMIGRMTCSPPLLTGASNSSLQ